MTNLKIKTMNEFENLVYELKIIKEKIESENLKISDGVGDEYELLHLKIKYHITCAKLGNLKL